MDGVFGAHKAGSNEKGAAEMNDSPQKSDDGNIEIGKIVSKYVELKKYIDDKKAAMMTEIGPQIEAQTAIRKYLLAFLQSQKMDSFKTAGGTVFRHTETTYKVADNDLFWNFLAESGLWNLAALEPITSAINEWCADEKDRRRAQATQRGENPPDAVLEVGLIPPGLNRVRFQSARVRKK